MAIEIYQLADTLNGVCDPETLEREVIAEPLVTTQISGITAGADIRIEFQAALDAGQKTALDAVVAAHTGVPDTTEDPMPVTVVQDTGAAPVVVTNALYRSGQDSFRRTDDGTEQMNVDGTSGGSTVIVWNGTGAADTGGDWTREGVGSETTGADRGSGTNGLDTGVMSKNDEVGFAFGSNQDIAGTYGVLRFWMRPMAFPGGSQPKIQWRDSANANKGSKLQVSDYVTNMDLDVWQQVEIPISDFNLGAELVDSVVIRFEKKNGMQFHFDDVELGGASGGNGPYTFQLVAPDALTRYHVSMLVFVVSGPSSGWTSDSFANIPALPNGLILRQRNLLTGEVLWHFNSKDNADLFGRYHPQDDIEFADATMLVGFMVKPGKSSIVVTDEWVLEFLVRDDLSALAQGRAYAHYGVEDLT